MLEFYLKSQTHRVISRDLSLDMLSHAYILECPDDVVLKAYSMLMAKEIYCVGSGDKPCCACNYCNKIEHGNMVDLKIYPKEKNIVVDDVLDVGESELVLLAALFNSTLCIEFLVDYAIYKICDEAYTQQGQ